MYSNSIWQDEGGGCMCLNWIPQGNCPFMKYLTKCINKSITRIFFVIALGGNDLNRYSHFYFFTISYVIMCLFVFLNTALRQKMTVFGQDIYNRHGYKCTHTNTKIVSLKITIDLEGLIFTYQKRIWNKPWYLKVMKISDYNL